MSEFPGTDFCLPNNKERWILVTGVSLRITPDPSMLGSVRVHAYRSGEENRVCLDLLCTPHGIAGTLLTALENIVCCAHIEGPAGTTAYVISKERMAAAKRAVKKARG